MKKLWRVRSEVLAAHGVGRALATVDSSICYAYLTDAVVASLIYLSSRRSVISGDLSVTLQYLLRLAIMEGSVEELQDRYRQTWSQLQQSRAQVQATAIRLKFRESESKTLQVQAHNLQDKLSLQIHTIKDMQRSLHLDPNLNDEFRALKKTLTKKKEELTTLESLGGDPGLSKASIRGRSLQDQWQKFLDETSQNYSDFAEGKLQDALMIYELQRLHSLELEVRLKEAQELTDRLDAEARLLQRQVAEKQSVLKQAYAKLTTAQQENARLRKPS